MGTLFLIATPIGNLEDISIRAIQALFSVDILACEDTRVTGNLLSLLSRAYPAFAESKTPQRKLISYRDENEMQIVPELMRYLNQGLSVGIVSDAGMPLVSDPGYRIVKQCIADEVKIVVIPGVSAVSIALVGSGFPALHYTFLGYFPQKQKKRIDLLRSLEPFGADHPYIVYVAPHKLRKTLEDLNSVWGNIYIVVARELTKLYEEYWRGTIEEALLHFTSPKGECVLLFTLGN